jgi:Protein of unknown function (DUF1573)
MKTRILPFTFVCRALALCVGGSILLSVGARAELKWEQNTIDLHPSVGDKQAVAHFKYENVGKTALHFKSVKASCGCTATQTQKEVVNPGEKGEVTATFTIGDRTGMQLKTVTVQTDDPNPAEATTVLTLKANITPALEIRPTFVYWTSGEAPKPKKISVKAAKEFPAKNITINSNNPNFESKVDPGKVQGEWTIEITPKETSRPMAGALLIQTDYPKADPKSFYVNAQITQPMPPPFKAPTTQIGAPTFKPATPAPIPSASPGTP